jgi:hypothetical protein
VEYLCLGTSWKLNENQSPRKGANPDLSDKKRTVVSFRVTILIPSVMIEMLSLPLVFPSDIIRRIILDTRLEFIIESHRPEFDSGFLYSHAMKAGGGVELQLHHSSPRH